MTDRVARVASAPKEHPKLVRGPGDRLVVVLDPLDSVFHNRGYYGKSGDLMPVRYRFLDPAAHDSLRDLEKAYPGVFYYTDVFRNASGSRGRRKKNRERRIRAGKSAIYAGKKPGFSAHSYGLSFDLDVDRSLRNLRTQLEDRELDKADLDAVLKEYGWWCHRDGPHGGDHRRGAEDWHYNYFGDDPDRWLSHSYQKTSGGVEAKIQYLYGPFTLDRQGVAEHLDRLGYLRNWLTYDDDTVKKAVADFQREWTLEPDGVAGPVTQRTLLYVGAEFRDRNGAPLDVPGP